LYVKVYYNKCPDCGRTWSARFSEANVIRLGRETYTCKCPKEWQAGHIEWVHLTPEQRKSYFFSTAELGVVVMCVLAPALFGYFVGSRGFISAGIAAGWGLLVGLGWVGFLWFLKVIYVKLSLRRLPHPVTDLRGGWPWNW
jgi:hypothetical protein